MGSPLPAVSMESPQTSYLHAVRVAAHNRDSHRIVGKFSTIGTLIACLQEVRSKRTNALLLETGVRVEF
jgi:hypothetical protein